MTKRHRLYAALLEKQNSDRCANSILGLITQVMNPVRHVATSDVDEGAAEHQRAGLLSGTSSSTSETWL